MRTMKNEIIPLLLELLLGERTIAQKFFKVKGLSACWSQNFI